MNAWVIEISWSYAGDSSYFLIWYETENGENRLITQDGKLMWFSSENEAKDVILSFGMRYAHTVSYDAERLWYWVRTHENSQIILPFTSPPEVDCDFRLNFWNLFSDIADSVGSMFEPVRTRRSQRCYDKLFYGLNLPAVTPGNQTYTPIFTHKELKYIRELMQCGLEMLENK